MDLRGTIAVCVLLAWSRDAAADPPTVGSETVVVIGAAPRGGPADLVGDDAGARDRQRALATAPFVTVVHVDDHAGERATVADLVGATVGAHVRSLGGLGAFASISVRGEAPGQTAIFVDGVPVSRIASVTADLGRFDTADVDRVELYRGGAPVEFGGAALGGALNLVTPLGRGAHGETWHAAIGVGSFGAREVRIARGDGDPSAEGVATWAAVGYAGATGDFVYFDDGGTNLDASDDHDTRRTNDGYDQLDGALRAGGERGTWTWRAGVKALAKAQGLPGSAWQQTARASLSTWSGLADAQAAGAPFGDGGPTTTARTYALIEAQRFRDPLDEIGVDTDDRRYLTLSGGATSAWRWQLGRHDASAAIDLHADWYRDQDTTGMRAPVRGRRGAIGLAVADDVAFADARVIVTPAARLDAARTDPIGLSLQEQPIAPPRTDVLPSPRLGVRVLARPDLAIKTSAGWYARMPTVVELYGDRGFLVGTPGLRPETGPSADLGLVWAPDGAVDDEADFDRVMIEAAAFVARPRDTIAFVSTGGLVARPLNLGDADIRGGELAVTWRMAKLVTFAVNYTYADARQRSMQPSYDGKRLPGRPVHEAYARADAARRIGGHLAVVFADVAHTAGSYLDQANLAELPARTLLGAGVKLELGGGFLIGVDGKNLGDQRLDHVALDPPPRPDLTSVPRAITDFGGYPLPGRAFYLTLEWNH